MTHTVFLPSGVSGHLGGFQLGAAQTSAAGNTLALACGDHTLTLLQGVCLQVELSDHMFHFIRSCHTFVMLPPVAEERSGRSFSSTTFGGRVAVPHCSFKLHFLAPDETEHLF